MALIELLNNDPKFFYYSGQGNFTQKSIPYGNDRQGGGDSGQPFQQFPLPENAAPATLEFYELNKVGNDYPLRGGSSINYVSNFGNPLPLTGKYDRDRISKFLKTSQGNIFLAKQKQLQFANPKMEVGEVSLPFGQPVGNISPGGTEYTRVYNERSLLEQVKVQGSGLHYDRIGNKLINPFFYTYEYTVKNKKASDNRLFNLYKTKISKDFYENPSITYQLGISTLDNLLFEYNGGPGSVGGDSTTTIRRTEDTTLINEPRTFSYNQLSSLKKLSDDADSNVEYSNIRQDFRNFVSVDESSDYLTNSIPVRYKIDSKRGTGDNIGKRNPEIIPKANFNPWANLDTHIPDLINFGFEAIEYGDYNTFIQFRAFLTNFGDNHQATYNPINYVGRGETFQVYNGFTRNVSFGFILAAQSKAELMPLYNKLNVFVSQLYPDYGTNSFMRTPVVKMTAGDYLYRQPGFLNSINLTIEQDYPWELESGNGSYQLPHVIKADCQFTPLHDFLPRRITLNTEDRIVSGKSLINQNRGVSFNVNKKVSETIQQQQLQKAREEEAIRLQNEAEQRAAVDFVNNNLPGFLQQLNNVSI